MSKPYFIADYLSVRGKPVAWQTIKAVDVQRWNKSTVLQYAKARGLRVDVSPKDSETAVLLNDRRTVFIGVGVGNSYRAALIDLLTYEERTVLPVGRRDRPGKAFKRIASGFRRGTAR